MSIKLEHLNYVYSQGTAYEKNALCDICLEIPHGEFVGIIGHTGSGKSTLIQHLNGLLRATSGELYYNGENIYQEGYSMKGLRNEVGLVFQYPEHQLFDDTVEKDVAFGAKNLGLTKDEQAARAKQAIELVGLDYAEFAQRSPFELSGGQKRRVAIAGVIAMHPKILVLDEPTAGLDPKGKREIMKLILNIKQLCPTVIMISHNMDEIAEYCNKIAVMKNGAVAGVYTPRELFGSRETIGSCGVALPLVTELAAKLCAAGLPVDPATLTEDDLIKQLTEAARA